MGGIISALAITLIALYFFRRRQYSAISKERPVNVLQDDEDGHAAHEDLPHYFTPEPYLIPDPTIGGTSDAVCAPVGDRRQRRRMAHHRAVPAS